MVFSFVMHCIYTPEIREKWLNDVIYSLMGVGKLYLKKDIACMIPMEILIVLHGGR